MSAKKQTGGKHGGNERAQVEEYLERAAQLEKEKDELFGKLQRLSADYDNYQKRALRQIADTVAYEKEKVIKALLPAMDNIEHTLDNTDSVESVEALVAAVRIIRDQMLGILKGFGAEPIEALGTSFDPALHQALMQKSDPQCGNNVILEQFQSGYKLAGRVIRPSKVVVNKLSAPEGQ